MSQPSISSSSQHFSSVSLGVFSVFLPACRQAGVLCFLECTQSGHLIPHSATSESFSVDPSGFVEARIGSTLTVEKDGAEKTFTIVGSEESKPEENKISNESPLGKAFLGKRAGEKVKVETPGGEAEYEIISIS